MTKVAAGHTVRKYDQELGNARAMVLKMGGQVLEQVRKAVSALDQGDVNSARGVVAGEPEIDSFELEIDEAIFELIFKRQPTAIDLRFILALSRIAGNLERAGDQAAQIAWYVLRLVEQSNHPLPPEILHHIHSLDRSARSLLEHSLNALAEIDTDLATEVLAGSPRSNGLIGRRLDTGTESPQEIRRSSSRIEDEFDAAMHHAITFASKGTQLVDQIVNLVFVLRALTKIGDQAGSIAEQVIFIAKGEDVRYQNKEILVDTLRKGKKP